MHNVHDPSVSTGPVRHCKPYIPCSKQQLRWEIQQMSFLKCTLSPEERPLVGQMVNETRAAIEQKLEETKKKMEALELEHKLKKEVIDEHFRQRKTV